MHRTIFNSAVLAICLILTPQTSTAADASPSGFHPELVEVTLAATEVRPGDPISYTLKFRNAGTEPSKREYMVFTHFEAPKKSCENIVIHADHPPADPTTQWGPGQTIVDGPHSFIVPAGAAEGDYFIHVGVYDHHGKGGRILDVYSPSTIRVSATAPAADTLGPKALPHVEIVKRRAALAQRFTSGDQAQLNTRDWCFRIDRNSGAWSLEDKVTRVLWTSNTAQPRFGRVFLRNGDQHAFWDIDRFDNVISTPRSLRLITRPTVNGKPVDVNLLLTVVPAGNTGALQLAYATRATGPWKVTSVRLLDAALQVTEADQGCYYVPHRLGIELPANSGLPSNQVYTTYNNLSMAMCGMTKQGSALLVSWQNVDSRLTIHTTWPDLPLVPGHRARAMSLELEGDANTCLIHPLGKGSYVEIAKAYRRVARAAGWRRTWSDKRKFFPTVDRIFGAADFKPFLLTRIMPGSRFNRSNREQVSLHFTFDEVAACAEHWRNDLQIDRAFVVLAGWINGGYDVRHPDVLPPAPECGGTESLVAASKQIRDCGYLFGLHDNYQDMYEDAPSWGQQWLNKDSLGVARKGGNWAGGQAWQVCAIKQVELAARKETNLPAIAKLFQPTIYFIDTVFAWPLVTCEDPAHPMTRRDDMIWKTKLCLLAKQYFGLFGSEEGREWAVPCADYLEGIFGHQTDSPPGKVIPLFPIVYSDCVQIMTHQGNRIGPGDEKKVADHILFAEMFLPRFGTHKYWTVPQDTKVPIVPLEPKVRQTNPRRFEITYRWRATKALTKDYRIFVHFTNESVDHTEKIAFQNDHRPTTPTSNWTPGEVIEDGPYTVDVPNTFSGRAEINVGMLEGDNRVVLATTTRQRQRYNVGAIAIGQEGSVTQESAAGPLDGLPKELWSRADNGWAQQLCPTDRVIKNVWEVLSPLNRLTAELPLDDHQFLTPDRLVQQTRFGDTTITVAYEKPARLGDNSVPPYGFIIEGPYFIAFCATRYNGIDYASPTLFTAQSLDGKPIRDSQQVRIYHGFGAPRVRLFDKEFSIEREQVVSLE